jgi:hypothetical protein
VTGNGVKDWNEAPEITRKHLVTAIPQSYGYRASHRLYRPIGLNSRAWPNKFGPTAIIEPGKVFNTACFADSVGAAWFFSLLFAHLFPACL